MDLKPEKHNHEGVLQDFLIYGAFTAKIGGQPCVSMAHL